MAAAWPVVVGRLVAVLPTLPGWSGVAVYDGEPVTGDNPTDFVTVGFVPGEDFAGSYEQTRNGEGSWQGALEETGTVRSRLVSTTGDVNLTARRARVFALADAWEAWLMADPTLGVLGVSSTSSLSVDVEPVQNSAGSAVALIVTVSYLTRS